jgi:hypothetical protein
MSIIYTTSLYECTQKTSQFFKAYQRLGHEPPSLTPTAVHFVRTHSVNVLRMFLPINTGYFPKQQSSVGPAERSTLCPAWGTSWVFMGNEYSLRLRSSKIRICPTSRDLKKKVMWSSMTRQFMRIFITTVAAHEQHDDIHKQKQHLLPPLSCIFRLFVCITASNPNINHPTLHNLACNKSQLNNNTQITYITILSWQGHK